MKLANDILLKKYIIQMVANPGTFYAVEYGKDVQSEAESYILQKNVEPFRYIEEIPIGQVVAVKYENRFHRAWITDVYHRYLKPVYCVLLEHNGNIEVSADSVYKIKSSELRNKRLNSYEITLNGVQPAIIDLIVCSVLLEGDTYKNNLKGIFHKRESDNWSPAAVEFTEELFKRIKYIYVNCVEVNGLKITGDIYYKAEGDDMLTSLAQTLCDKDFAVLCGGTGNLPISDDIQDDRYLNCIERKIPKACKSEDWEESSTISFRPTAGRKNVVSDNSSSCSGSNKSSSTDPEKSLNSSKDQASSSGTCIFSPSWILKKMGTLSIDSPSTSSGSFKGSPQNTEQAEKAAPGPKINMLRIVQRSVALHDKRK